MNQERIHKIANHFGIELQKNQLIEELAELVQALCKLNKNGIDEVTINKVVEEIADVKIMIEQIIYLLEIKGELEKAIQIKVNRTISIMDYKT